MRAVIICSVDAFANGIKPKKIRSYLEQRGYEVELFNSCKLGRLGRSGIRNFLPAPDPRTIGLFVLDMLLTASSCLGITAARHANAALLLHVLRLRGRIVAQRLRSKNVDLIICESNLDQAFVLFDCSAAVQILDLPAPFAEELYYGKLLTRRGFKTFKDFEIKTYAAADKISFHWPTYAEFVKKTKYDGPNFINLTYGVEPKTVVAQYSADPKIIFLGYLQGYWVNVPLLAKLCRLYPNLDVYGGPPPPVDSGIRYKGYAPSLDIMAEYQFGLTTISDDELRKHSFSSKHLEYISYGLPVLTPAWRQDRLLDDSSIYYTAETFLEQVRKYSAPKAWRKKHLTALRNAKEYSWEAALRPLAQL